MRVDSRESLSDQPSSRIEFEAEDLKEVFSLFASCTAAERAQVYDDLDPLYFRDVELSEEYSLTAEKREFALDALRAVLSFLHSRGYALTDRARVIDLAFIEDEFIKQGQA